MTGRLRVVLLIGLLGASGQAAAGSVQEASVPTGKYYVGRAMGVRDYRTLANASTPGYRVMREAITEGLFVEVSGWAAAHGYGAGGGCPLCDRGRDDRSATLVTWRDAALFANALSEYDGLDPVYRDVAGQPVRDPGTIDQAVAEPSLSGYRLPTIPEWQIAMRGGAAGLADGSYGADPRSPNALGLSGAAGPLAEWTASTMDVGAVRATAFVCNVAAGGRAALSACEQHGAGWSDATVTFRLVRRGP